MSRGRGARRQLSAGVAAVWLLAGASVAGSSAAAAADPATAPAAEAPAPLAGPSTYADLRPTTLTLVTGDRIRVVDVGQGRSAVRVDPPSSDPERTYARFDDADGHAHVVPTAVIGLLGDRLDPALFDVTALVRDGFDDANRATIPLIVETTEAPLAPPGTTLVRELRSVRAVAVTADRSGAAVLGTALVRAAADRSFLTGMERIWLDARVRASLDEVVPQIGAPAAYAAGYDGTGVRVAVLDSGIDTDHPDLAGRVVAAQDFTGLGGTGDGLGHGTHAASIVGGSGAASGGRFRGVAYGADLINARVLDEFGWGELSTVIAGLEWAAIEQDADVISISANGGVSDGTDILSEAIDAVSAAEDVLVVASAGNRGGAVETPGSADAALAVGAVDKTDVWQPFSAHGPRDGRLAIKPEVVAPGVSVTAAITPDAYIGDPVDEFYAALSGTSTAAPVVAGAAALLRQAHPDLTAAEIKSLLVTSGADVGETVFAQGGGRVDVAGALAAAASGIVPVESTLPLGVLAFPHDDGETRTGDLHLVNTGPAEVRLDLSVAAVDEAGAPVPPTMLTLSPAEIVLPAGGSGAVTVTADPAVGPLGLISGSVVVSLAGEEVLHVPVGFEKERESYELTVQLADRSGGSNYYGFLGVVELEEDLFSELYTVDSQTTELAVRVPAGTYSLTFLSDQSSESFVYVDVTAPQVVVDRDTVVVLDGRGAEPIEVELDTETTPLGRSMTVFRSSRSGAAGYIISFEAGIPQDVTILTTPTDPVTLGQHHLGTSWAGLGDAESFHLLFDEAAGIPSEITYVVGRSALARVGMDVHADVPDADAAALIMGYGPYVFLVASAEFPIPARSHHDLWVTGGTDVGWAQQLRPVQGNGSGDLFHAGSYAPGSVTAHSWFGQPVRPGAPPNAAYAATRDAARMDIQTFLLDGDRHYGFSDASWGNPPVDDISMRLLSEGVPIVESADLSISADGLAPGRSRYELELDTTRTASWAQLSTETHTVWSFDSERPATGEVTALPILHVNPSIELGLDNAAPGAVPVTFRATRMDQFEDELAALVAFGADFSIDDGTTWHPVAVDQTGTDSYAATIDPGAACGSSCFISLRMTATEASGSSVEQEVLRAYTGAGIATTPTPTIDPTYSATPTPTPTSTLPGTGASGVENLLSAGLAAMTIGGLMVALATRRLRTPTD